MDARAQDFRAQRGIALAKDKAAAIKPIVGDKYIVPSATHPGTVYVVDVSAGSCSCPDWESFNISGRPQHRCKHLIATLAVLQDPPQLRSSSAVIEEKHYYPRDWHATNRARTEIARLGPALLADLVNGLGLAPAIGGVRGRPPISEADILLAAALRAFEDSTAGTAVVAAENYRALGTVNMDRIPSYNSLLREFAKPKYMPYLHRLVAGSAAPLLPLETVYAIDGTGFGTSVYSDYFLKKHGPKAKQRAESPHHHWVQANLVWGTTTHVIVAAQITEIVSECQLMPTLLKRAVNNGARIQEWVADAAYMAWYNVKAVEDIGATPYIDFPARVTGATRPIIRRLYNKMKADPEDYKKHYSHRSLAESGNAMIKVRYSHRLRSRVPNAMYAEAMLRCVCHNVACIVQAVEELHIDPKYWAPVTAFPSIGGSR